MGDEEGGMIGDTWWGRGVMDGGCMHVVFVNIYSKERNGGYTVQSSEVIILNSSYRIHTCVAYQIPPLHPYQ